MQIDPIDRQLDEVSKCWDLLKHPFYQRWVAGELTPAELTYYAGQYAHVVRAIPRWLLAAGESDQENAAELKLHAAEEHDHIALWEQFAGALGIDQTTLQETRPNAATAALVARGDALADSGHAAAVVWSIEAQSPAVAAEKLRGLKAHYKIEAHTGGQYFALHQELDKEHEAQLRRVIRTQDASVQHMAPVAAATMLEAMWRLLSAAESVRRCQRGAAT